MNHLNEIELNEYLDQMLDKATQKKVEAHLADCEKCRAQVNDLKTLFSTLDELPEIPLTRNLTPNILVR
ncbi:MAG: zf-HC2 domain-containing protein, partial [Anaerolineae bacterium]|nr:zf-HC2 domain-containing protein [Anaerolineae bacterium]